MGNRIRSITALVNLALYLLIMAGPLAPLAVESAGLGHATVAECAGDCSLCGCSAERSASHTCCCARKHRQPPGGNAPVERPCCKKNLSAHDHSLPSIAARPCSSKKFAGFTGIGHDDTLPCRTVVALTPQQPVPPAPDNPAGVTDWLRPPPEPPPKLS
jgi:hypothetical protein